VTGDRPPPATEAVAGFVCGVRLDEVTPEVVRLARRHVLDTAGVMLSGRRQRAAALARDHALATGGGELSPALAAFVLGVRGHVDDYDDTQLATRPEGVYGLLTHPSVPVLAGVLAAALVEDAAGDRALEAFVAALEAECRISDAIDPRHYREGFHSSGTVGTLGAALGAAKLLGLDEERTRTALGIAASSAAGVRENFGTMTKSLHVGRAAQHGVEAALLARSGWTAAPDVLEAPRGFFRAFGGGFDPALVTDRLGDPWFLSEPGVSLKPHPGGSLSHPAMWVFSQMMDEHGFGPDDVEHVTVGTSSNIPNALIHHRPADSLAAKFSMEYAIATLLGRGRGGLAEYEDDAVREPVVQELIPRIDLVADPVAEEAGFHRMLSRITVRLRDGSELFAEGDTARGHPLNPMTDAEVEAKFDECAAWGGVDGEPIKRLIASLESERSTAALTRALL
jgi:2-methylcitrate dehydratase PrpD